MEMNYTLTFAAGEQLISEMSDQQVRGYAVDQYVEIKRMRHELDEERRRKVSHPPDAPFSLWCVGIAAAALLGLLIGFTIGAA